MLNMLRGAALFHSRDIDELAEALSDEDSPRRANVHRAQPRTLARDGKLREYPEQKAG